MFNSPNAGAKRTTNRTVQDGAGKQVGVGEGINQEEIDGLVEGRGQRSVSRKARKQERDGVKSERRVRQFKTSEEEEFLDMIQS